MSIFGKIMGVIFGSHPAAAAPAGGCASGSAPAQRPRRPHRPRDARCATVDVAAIVDKLVAAQKEKLEWRTSIVDLMKALDIDSSLAARKDLAKELGYSGDMNDSASMNVWLHKQVMSKLAANGGKAAAGDQALTDRSVVSTGARHRAGPFASGDEIRILRMPVEIVDDEAAAERSPSCHRGGSIPVRP